jgi:hypothetical protein
MKIKSYIQTAHAEETPDSPYTIGVIFNYDEDGNRLDSFPYLYKDEIYVFFNTIIELIEYLIYNNKNINRSYLKEVVFDNYYDNHIDGLFKDVLEWIDN